MGYQFCDPFDNYGNNYTLTNGYPWDVVSNASVITSDYRFAPPAGLSGGCCKITQNGFIQKTLAGTPGTILLTFGMKCSNIPSSGQQLLSSFYDTGNFQCALMVTGNAGLQLWKGNGLPLGGGGNWVTQVGATSVNGTIMSGAWNGFQVLVTIDSSGGAIQVYMNGNPTPVLSSTGINTRGTANSYATQVQFNCPNTGGGGDTRFDDIVILDTSGVTLNALPGSDSRLFQKVPNGAGFYTNWTPNGLGSNYQNVAVMPPSAADYNANNVGGTKDSYALPSAGILFNPLMVLARASLEKDDGNTHTPSLMVRSSSTDGVGSALNSLGSSYLFYDTVFPTDPNSGTAWTAAAADSAQVGVVEG